MAHSPVWLVSGLVIFVVFFFDINETYNVFNLQGHYTKKTFDHLRSYGGHVFMADGFNDKYWFLIYATWPIMLLYFASTFFRESQNGYLYQAGYLHWSSLLCASGGMILHMRWLQKVEELDLSGAVWSAAFCVIIMSSGLFVLLTHLAKKAEDLQIQGLGRDVRILRSMIIDIYDIYISHMLTSMLVTIDTYLVGVLNFSPVNTNFYIFLAFSLMQCFFLFSDIFITSDRTFNLLGGYITLIYDSFAFMIYQMRILRSVPLMTVINFVVSVNVFFIKIALQSNPSVKSKQS